MNSNNHITEFLDRAVFAELDEQSRTAARSHIEKCADCRKSFAAARISEMLIKANSEMPAPAPSEFFQAKVMTAWREKQIARRPAIAAFRRWWQASLAPVSMMLIMLGGLISLTVFAPQSSDADDAPIEISGYNTDSAEAVLLNQNLSGEMTTEQVFQEIYNTKSDLKK